MAGKAGKKAGAPEATQVAEPEVDVLQATFTFEKPGAWDVWEKSQGYTGFAIPDFEATECEVDKINLKADTLYIHLRPASGKPVFIMNADSLKMILPAGRVSGDGKNIIFDMSGLVFFSDGDGTLKCREA